MLHASYELNHKHYFLFAKNKYKYGTYKVIKSHTLFLLTNTNKYKYGTYKVIKSHTLFFTVNSKYKNGTLRT